MVPTASPLSPVRERIVAFIDLGTNSVRLLLVRIAPDRSYTILSQQKEVVRLGKGEFTSHRLRPEAMDRAVFVCNRFAEMARAGGAHEIVAVATSASREARNRREFLARLRDEAKLDVRIISGKEEARLIYLGVASALRLDDRQCLFIDVGGGSTEVILGNQKQHLYLDSLQLGAIRLAGRFFKPGDDGPISKALYKRIKAHVRHHALRAIQALEDRRIDLAVGSSGTVLNLVDVTIQRRHGRTLAKDDVVTLDDLRETVERLCALSLAERRKVPGLNPDRADIIVAGAAVVETLLETLKVPSLRASDRGLRDGLLIDYLSRVEPTRPLTSDSFRERSVLQLGRACDFDEAHAFHVARLSLTLFDSTRDLGLHDLGEWERELLEYAALLHDIGAFLSYTNHQVHTHYFIRSAELLGFDEKEITLVALAARYHQKSYPDETNHEFAALDRASQRVVKVLCTLLRLAECLDRGHMGVVRSARVVAAPSGANGGTGVPPVNSRSVGGTDLAPANRSRAATASPVARDPDANGKSAACTDGRGLKTCRLLVQSAGDCRLELWGVESRKKAFRKTFGVDLEVIPPPSTNDAQPAQTSSPGAVRRGG